MSAARALVFGVLLLAWPTAARASEPLPDKLPPPSTAELGALRVRAEAVPQCMSAQPLVDALAREFPDAGAVAAELVVVGGDDAIAFELVSASGSAARRFRFEDGGCEQRVRVVALSMALALEALVTEKPRVDPAPTGRAPSSSTSTKAAAAAPTIMRTAKPRPRLGLGVGVLGAFGDAPAPQLGGSLQPRIGGERWTVRARAALAGSTEAELGGGRLRVLSFAVLVDGCARWSAGKAAMLACGGVELGLTRARGRGYAHPRRDVVPMFGPAGAFELVAPITPRLALAMTAGAVIPVLRARFVGDTASSRSWPVVVRAGLALVIALGRPKP